MATGKTEVGRALARRFRRPMVDADDEVESRAGKSVAIIFSEDGEEVFRAMEKEVIRDLCLGTGHVVAVGGGAFVDPENRKLMLTKGLVICLSARPETVYDRIAGNEDDDGGGGEKRPVRPLLLGGNQLERIESLMAQRAHAYAEAHYTVQSDDLTVDQVAERILEICLA